MSVRITGFALALGLLAGGPAVADDADCKLDQLAEMPVTMRDLAPMVAAKINGHDTRLVADSGSFFSMLTPQSARKLGLKVGSAPWGLALEGVNGRTETGLTHAKAFTVMGVTFPDTDFLVAAPQLGDYTDGLLGQNFLGMADAEFDFANGVIRVFKPVGCGDAALAYWATDKPFSIVDISDLKQLSNEIRAEVKVNGVTLHAVFDTGTQRSMLTRRAARAAGLDVNGPGARPGGLDEGVARGAFQTWIVPVATFQIGQEEVKHTELRVGDIDLDGDDMLLGADFFLSHRLFIAKSQGKLYLSYNGGPVFNLEGERAQADPASRKLGVAP